MFVLGLTGSIGMGKSTAARMFAARGAPVFDADAEVHRLYAAEAVVPIADAFGDDVVADGRIDRAALSRRVVGDPGAIARLEAIVHPLVRGGEHAFLARAAAAGVRLAVLEIPLLLETGGAARADAVAVVSAPAEVQRRRVLGRAGMDDAKLDAILARQMPDAEKRRHAHFVVDTSGDFAFARKQVDDILRALAARPGNVYPGSGG